MNDDEARDVHFTVGWSGWMQGVILLLALIFILFLASATVLYRIDSLSTSLYEMRNACLAAQ